MGSLSTPSWVGPAGDEAREYRAVERWEEQILWRGFCTLVVLPSPKRPHRASARRKSRGALEAKFLITRAGEGCREAGINRRDLRHYLPGVPWPGGIMNV